MRLATVMHVMGPVERFVLSSEDSRGRFIVIVQNFQETFFKTKIATEHGLRRS